ncbi:MAG: hypothetical protein U0169_11040 [Polyangiaceae bacterium]
MTTRMAKRKKPARSRGPVLVDGFLHFNQVDLLRYELAQAQVLNALQGIGLKKSELERLRVEHEERQRAGQGELAELTSFARAREFELQALQRELEKTYELDLTRVTYDDVSGKIMLLGEPVRRK